MEDLQVSVRGKQTQLKSFAVNGVPLITRGRFLRIASIHSEEYVESHALPRPEIAIEEIRRERFPADLYSFALPITEQTPRFDYPHILDNAAVIELESFDKWMQGLSQDTRRNVRLAAKRGVEVRLEPFTTEFAAGISSIYNENPIRQGRKFWHYGKPVETVKAENGTYLERSSFIGAWQGSEMVGFLKFVQTDSIAGIMQILSKMAHQDKKVTNALLAKAVEVAAQKKCSHLVYCKYTYHKNIDEPLREFKRRNGFVKLEYPRYFAPLTAKGRVAVACQLHRPKTDFVPGVILSRLLKLRLRTYEWLERTNQASVRV